MCPGALSLDKQLLDHIQLNTKSNLHHKVKIRLGTINAFKAILNSQLLCTSLF